MGEPNKIEAALEAISKKMAEMEGRLLPADQAKALMDQKAEAEAKAKQQDEVDKQVEKALRARAERDPALISDADHQPKGRYTFADAQREIGLVHKTARVPYWDEKTERGFSDWCKAVAMGDRQYLLRAKANAPYTETTSAGGYLVPNEYRAELVRAAYQKSLALQLCRIVPMNDLVCYLPSVTAGTTAVWGSINTATGDTKVTLGQITLTAYPLVGISYVPNELIQDSMLSIGGLLADEFTDSFARKIDNCAFSGDATSSTAYKADGWSDAATTNRAGSGTSGDSANGSLAYDHIMDMVGKLSSTALNGAVMIMAPTTFAQVRTISDAGSNLLVNIDKDYRYNILGFPTYLSDNMTAKASVAAGDALILFGNPRNYIIGDRMDLSIQSSEHIAFTANQTVFRAIQRIAMSVGIETELAVLARMAAGGTYGPASS